MNKWFQARLGIQVILSMLNFEAALIFLTYVSTGITILPLYLRLLLSITVYAGSKLHDGWKRVRNVCFGEEGLGICEQPHGEINFCVQAVCLSCVPFGA